MKIFNFVLYVLLSLVILDVLILGVTIVAVASGSEVTHIPFWDSQIKFVVNLLN